MNAIFSADRADDCGFVVNSAFASDLDAGRSTLDVRAQSALGFRTKSAHEKDNQADQQNQAETTAADGRPANIKAAAAE
jgi:hypothetical protein